MFHRHQALQGRRRGRLLASGLVSASLDAKQADHNRPDRIAAVAHAEVQYQSLVCGEALGRRRSGELFDQPRLADASLAAHHNRLTAAARAAHLNHAGKLRQLGVSPDKCDGRGGCRRRLQTLDAPYPDRRIETLDGNFAERITIGAITNGAAQGIGDERLSRLRLVLKARRQIHRAAGNGRFAVCLTAGAAGNDLAIGDADMRLQQAAAVD